MEGKTLRKVISSLPAVQFLDFALDCSYASAKVRGNYVDQLVAHPKFGKVEGKELEDLQYRAIKQAFIHHYNDSSFYHKYCKSYNFMPDDLRGFADIPLIPQIPAEMFKQGGILSIPEKKIKTIVTTSGTRSNNPSILPRDKVSQNRLIKLAVRMILNVWLPEVVHMQSRSEKDVVKYALQNWGFAIFTPRPDETSTWMSQAISMIIPLFDLLHIDYEFYLEGFRFDEAQALERLKKQKEKDRMVMLWGFHYVLERLMQYMDTTGERLDLDPTGEDIDLVLLGGGWKTLTGETVDRAEFEKRLSEHFGIDRKWIVDFYGLGEVNSGAFDLCRDKKHHIFPNVVALTRDPDTLEPCAPGEKGLLSIYDPTMNSYPAFVVSDDMARLSEPRKCDCGIFAQDLTFEGRAPNAELRSCGLKIQQLLTDEEKRKHEALKANALKRGIGVTSEKK